MNLSSNSDFSSRLSEVMSEEGLETPADLAKFVSVGWTTAKQWLEGSLPRDRTMDHIAKKFRVNVKWLRDGESGKRDSNRVMESSSDYYVSPNKSTSPIQSTAAVALRMNEDELLETIASLLEQMESNNNRHIREAFASTVICMANELAERAKSRPAIAAGHPENINQTHIEDHNQ